MSRARLLAFAALLLACTLAQAARLPGIEALERSLHLDRAQKAQFDVAVAATQRALVGVGMGALQLKERIAGELAKPDPDLRAIVRAHEAIVEQAGPLFRDARREWQALYAMLDPRQVRLAHEYVEEKLGRLERLGESLKGLLGEGAGR